MHTASLILAATAAVVAAQAPTPPVLPAPWFNHAFGQTVGDQTASSVSIAILAENYDAPAPALVQVSYNTGFTGTQVVWQRDGVAVVLYADATGTTVTCQVVDTSVRVITPDVVKDFEWVGHSNFSDFPTDTFLFNNTGNIQAFFVTNASATIGAGHPVGVVTFADASTVKTPQHALFARLDTHTRALAQRLGLVPTNVSNLYNFLSGPLAAIEIARFGPDAFTPPPECKYPAA